MVVSNEVRVPLAGFPAKEPVEAVEAPSQRPGASRGSLVLFGLGGQVPLSHRQRRVSPLAQDLRHHAVLGRDDAAVAREAVGGLDNHRHTVAMTVAPREQARSGRRAQCRCVPVREPHTHVGETVHVRRLDDRRPEARERCKPCVVPHDVDDVRCVDCGLRWEERLPVRLRIPHVELDDPVELRHGEPPRLLEVRRLASLDNGRPV